MEDERIDYKAMYLRMFRAAEDAIKILTDAQLECEEIYVSSEKKEEQQTNECKGAQSKRPTGLF